jgi:hypothetical protein
MSTVGRVNFELISDLLDMQRRDFPLADTTLADPTGATCLVDGEWMTLDTSYKLVRASTITNLNEEASKRSFPLFAEKGRYDVRAIAGTKMPVLFIGEYEADTRIFNASADLGSGDPITAVMQPLKVATISIGTRYYTGLVGHGGSGDTSLIVGYVTRLPASNGGKLRFISGGRR